MVDKEKILKEIDNKINTLTEQGLTSSAAIEGVYKLVDIKKDMLEIEKLEGGKYGNYSEGGYGARGNYREGGYQEGNYSESGYGRRGNFREGGYGEGGYSEGGSYGRRGVKGTGRGRRRYRGDDMLDDMYGAYGEYEEGKEQYNRGNYGAEDQKVQSLKYMLESAVDFFKMLKEDASSQEEMEMIKKYAKKISEM